MDKEMKIGGEQGYMFERIDAQALRARIRGANRGIKEQEAAHPLNRRKPFPILKKPVEEITADLEALDAEEERLVLEKELDARLIAFREIYAAWLQRAITLDEMLTAMMASGLCNRLSPFE